MSSLTKTILAAIAPGWTPHSAEAETPGSDEPITPPEPEASVPPANPQEDRVSDNPTTGASVSADDISRARADGETAGRAAANERMKAILAAEGISGDGNRMSAAASLALGAPDMSADAVVAHVTAHTPAQKAAAQGNQAAAYDESRTAAATLGQPGGSPQADTAGWGPVVNEINAKRKGK